MLTHYNQAKSLESLHVTVYWYQKTPLIHFSRFWRCMSVCICTISLFRQQIEPAYDVLWT